MSTGVVLKTGVSVQETTTPTETTAPSTTSDVKVGSGQQPQASQTVKSLPGMERSLGKASVTVKDVFGDGTSSASFKSSLSMSAGLKAKVGFFSFLQKILPNPLASKLEAKVNIGDFRRASELSQTYARQQAETNPPATNSELRQTLQSLKSTLASQGAHHPDQIRNLAEMTRLIDGELLKLQVADMARTADGFVGTPELKAQMHAEVVLAVLKGVEDHPASFLGGSKGTILTSDMDELLRHHSTEATSQSLSARESHVSSEKTSTLQETGHKTMLEAYQKLAQKEMDQTAGITTLFRRTTEFSKLMGVTTTACLPREWTSRITDVINRTKGNQLEVDPKKAAAIAQQQNLATDTVVADSVRDLKAEFNGMMDHLGFVDNATTRSAKVALLPQELCDEMKVLHDAVEAKFGAQEAIKSVAANLMLRGLNPLLTAPQKGGLLPTDASQTLPPTKSKPEGETLPLPNVQRNLMLLSKLTQNAANGVLFGMKEDFMMTFNTDVQARFAAINAFASAVVNRGRPISTIPG